MQEILKDIPNIEWYQASNLGNIYSKRTNKFLSTNQNEKGYLRVTLYVNGKSKSYRVNRLIALTFIPNPNNYLEVNHKDGNKLNNNVDNLEWCNHLYNMQEAFKNNLIPPRKANSGSFKSGHLPNNCVKINQCDLQGNLLNTFYSLAEASRKTNFSATSIARYCKGLRKCKDYLWRYADE